jgi:hypothetical protein
MSTAEVVLSIVVIDGNLIPRSSMTIDEIDENQFLPCAMIEACQNLLVWRMFGGFVK